MSVEVRECDRKKLFAVIDEYQHYGTKDALAKINELFVLPERTAAAEEIRRLRAAVEAADGLRNLMQRWRDVFFCWEGNTPDDQDRLGKFVDAADESIAAYLAYRAACDSPIAESDPQDGLSDTGDAQGVCDDSV